MTIDALLVEKGYEIVHKLGEGSGGPVYKAVQRSTGQVVAVKTLSLVDLPEEVRARRLARFRREISFCSQLYHPDIVRLLDSGELDSNRHVAVFEFIPGSTLSEVLREARMLDVQRARNLMLQLLSPLAHAHSRGIFHRDLKPANIMVIGDGKRDRVKVLDFGISIAAGGEHGLVDRLTLTHEWVGTPAYAAPEQLGGEPGGAKADLYAWALVFVECLTGAPVVTGRSIPDIIRRQLPPGIHELPPALRSSRLGALLASVLEKDPDRRLGDATTVLSMLEPISISELEDAQGYLRDVVLGEPVAAAVRGSETLTDEQRPVQTESRHVSVVACRVLVDAAEKPASIERLDTAIEDANALAREVLTEFGANAADSFGEFSLAYFGIARASDSDAQLALRASLELIARLERASSWLAPEGAALRVQIGIHNGPVTLQRREGSRRKVDGVTAGVAIALAGLHTPGEAKSSLVLVSDDFRSVSKRYASFEPASAQSDLAVSWQRSPLGIYQLANGALMDGKSTSIDERSVFVGRKDEIGALHSAWIRSRAGVGTSVVVLGEPGIGKSRLVAELGSMLRAEGSGWLEARCLPEWQRGFLRPLSSLMRDVLGIAGMESLEAGSKLAQELLALGVTDRDAVSLLCDWLLVTKPAAYASGTWSPQKRRAMLQVAIADTLAAHLERGNVIVVEDLHWADPSTVECLDVFMQRASQRAAFLVLTTRPQLSVEWSVPVVDVQLGGLGAEASSQLVRTLVPNLDEATAARLAARCDGVPLFAEELAYAFAGSTADPATEPNPRSDALKASVPASLRDLLVSRLDEVGDAKEVAQFAAALGREFSLDVLAALMGTSELHLLGDLEQLVSARLLSKGKVSQGVSFVFRHALTREAAYDGMSGDERHRTHRRIAEGFERDFPEVVESQPDTLAHHWEGGGDTDRALHYLLLASERAAMASAHVETIAGLEHGLALLRRLPKPHGRARQEAELMLAKGAAIVAKRGYTDPEVASSYERAASLVPPRGDTLQLAFSARWGLWYFHNTQANLRESSRLADELDSIAKEANDDTLALNAYHALCLTKFSLGRFEEAVRASHGTEPKYDFERHKNLCILRGDDPHLACMSWGAIADMFHGSHDKATRRTDEALEFALKLGYPSLTAGTHANAAWMYLVWGSSGASAPELEACKHHAGIAIHLAQEHGFPFWTLYGGTIYTAARAALGDGTAAQELLNMTQVWRGAGANLALSFQFAFAGDAFRRAGEFDAAFAALEEGLLHCEQRNSRYFEAELYRIRAEVFLDPRNPKRDLESGRLECLRALGSADGCTSAWWRLATLATVNRCADLATPEDRASLREALHFFPVRETEPPLVREARELVNGAS